MTSLPLNAVEQYMLADDSVAYPRCFWIVVRLREALEDARLAAAIDGATRRHPLLRANVEYRGERPWRWVEESEVRGQRSEVREDDDGHEWVVRPFDLRVESGVRCCVGRGSDGDVLTVEFHHAATDGIGAVQFVSDLLALYGADCTTDSVALPELDAGRLATRDRFGLSGWRWPLRWLYGTLGWLGAIEYLVQRPIALGKMTREVRSQKPEVRTAAESASGAPSPCPLPEGEGSRASGFLSQSLTLEETAALFAAAKREGVTVNDLLVRDVFVATERVVERHWPERAGGLQRIMVPTNLRAADDGCVPACNVVAMINVDRRPGRWTDRRRMLRVLHWELSLVKRLRLGIIFVQVLHVLQTLFGSLRRFLPTDRCQATCVVSNLGPVFDSPGSEIVRGVEFYPPIRPLTAAAFGVLTHAGRLNVSLHYDAAALTSAVAQELIDELVRELRGYETDASRRATDSAGAATPLVGGGVMPSRS